MNIRNQDEKKKKEELVTIITAMYNSEKYIKNTIKSVLNQVYQNWEWIIIDDASIDNSLKIVQNFAEEDNRIKIIKKDNTTGQASSRNLGLKKSRGKLIAFLDSDDIWDKYFLKKQVEFLKTNNAKIVCSNYKRMNEERNECLAIEKVKGIIKYKDLLKRCYFSCLTTLFYKVDNIFFDETMEKLEDYLFWLEILKVYKFAFGNNEALGSYRIHQNSISSNKIKNIKWLYIIYRKKIKYSLLKSIYLTCRFIFINILKNHKTIKYLIKFN